MELDTTSDSVPPVDIFTGMRLVGIVDRQGLEIIVYELAGDATYRGRQRVQPGQATTLSCGRCSLALILQIYSNNAALDCDQG